MNDPELYRRTRVLEHKLERIENALREYLNGAGTGEFFARSLALQILDSEE